MKLFLSLFSIGLLVACTQTTITDGGSFIDPGWNGVSTNSMVVEVQDAPLSEQRAIESSTVAILREAGLRAEASYAFFPPTRTFSPAQKQERLRGSGYETLLVIRPYDRDIISHYSPPATRPFGGASYGSGGWGGVGFGVNFDRGYTTEEAIIRYHSDLYVIKDNHKIWTGDYATRGGDGMSFDTVGKRFGKELVTKLQKDGMIYSAP